jgi:DNA ligase D-like protein (predicted polymerase)/DNA ligase D-like protein (predicted 3'-phosphoesterase)
MENLKKYNEKRNFKKTNEPLGFLSDKKAKKNKLKFVVQHHIASKDHYDFRLEWKGVLLSWAVPKGPSFNTKDKRLAVQVEDHPLDYGDFEGTIPKGQYGGGTVMLWDRGDWEPYDNDVGKSLKNGTLKFALNGERLKGNWVLTKFKSEEIDNWLLIKEKDKHANLYDISQFKTSIKTKRTMEEISNNITKKENAKGDIKELLKKEGENYIVENIKISNPNKILFEKPKIKKIDVVLYYANVAKYMLPYIKNRILTVVRCPKGIEEDCFFKKHPNESNKKVETIQILNKDDNKDEYFYVKNASGIVSEAQMGTLEFHPWGSTIKNIEKPDIMVFDLDPSEKLNIKKLRQGVRDLKSILDNLSLISFLKTSGGKGYHVVVPFKPSADWDTFYNFAKQIAKLMEMTWPKRYTSNIRKQKRNNKIFIDWERNGKGATSIAPYSVRARKGAPVSMPIFWHELDTIKPNSIKIKDVYERIGKDDPWKEFFTVKQKLK